MSEKKIAALEKRISALEKRLTSMEKLLGSQQKNTTQDLEKKIKAEGKEAQKRGAELVLALQKKQREEAARQEREWTKDLASMSRRKADKAEVDSRLAALEKKLRER